ncbi:FAD-binding oxidoreductase [Dactylosporangium vinaceum]|uniref:FAD-binding oxidoreductase n=1 Tax=Dactylosporangium vinaceum TaxID=53362 RepID=A0ABV5M2U1_9ACTN|nr:FAD-linked oxidase C-terminal domain-containing protein [Dactylosporangium vinaceum]
MASPAAALVTDRSGVVPAGPPLAVVRAGDVEDVRRTLAEASRTGTPVVTRGAGTGLAGAAAAAPGEIVLDVSGLDRILAIDPVDQVARVEPGVITAELDRAAAAFGLMYAPDPGSVATCTIGGNIATNAGGLRGAKYGVTRDSVLALDVVLADGTLLHVGRNTVKGVAGLDLTGLIVGSEGTLGVVVGATLRLLPRPTRIATAVAYFASVADAAAAATGLGAAALRPAVLELVDAKTLAAIDALRGTGHAERGAALLLVQADGFGAAEELEAAAAVLARTATALTTTTDPAVAAELAAARRDALPAIEARGRALIEDIAVPRSRLAEAIGGVHAIAADTGTDIYTFAHAGDGNLHPIIRLDGDAEPGAVPPAAQRAADDIFALALSLGGTVTAEHGIGLLKRHWLERELDPAALALQRRIKALFDPAGILNPGKAI